ncbi:hypothetical protein GQX74_003443 [Glossina fuscipes]|nr:hypothetical protein GQX74_003443 [Glossina fuscipes]
MSKNDKTLCGEVVTIIVIIVLIISKEQEDNFLDHMFTEPVRHASVRAIRKLSMRIMRRQKNKKAIIGRLSYNSVNATYQKTITAIMRTKVVPVGWIKDQFSLYHTMKNRNVNMCASCIIKLFDFDMNVQTKAITITIAIAEVMSMQLDALAF